VSPELKKDVHVCMAAFKRDPTVLKWVDPSIRGQVMRDAGPGIEPVE
jgi:hypothetical protein